MVHDPIHAIVRRSAERWGSHLAVDAADHQLTYRQLVDRADELAAVLHERGAEPGSVVAILADRVGDVIAAMLATLEAGCAFMPLDVSFPVATLPAVIAEVEPRYWLVGPEHVEAVADLQRRHVFTPTVLSLGGIGEGAPVSSVSPISPISPAVVAPRDPEGLCYVYFTSGSTGRPKGIGGRLKAIDHFIRWEIETLGIGPGTRISQLTSPAFDAFLRDAFVPLAAGGTVCVPGGREVLLDCGLDRAARSGARPLHTFALPFPARDRTRLEPLPGAPPRPPGWRAVVAFRRAAMAQRLRRSH
jgi:non-ribosomal peptide synthetase component F